MAFASLSISNVCLAVPEYVVNGAESFFFALLFAVVVLGWFSLRRFPSWFRSQQSSNWPTAVAVIETGDVTTVRSAGVLKEEAEYANAEISYSYVVDGDRYSGYYAKQFFNEQSAWEFVAAWKGQSVTIRYKLGEPQCSVFRLRDQKSTQLVNPVRTV